MSGRRVLFMLRLALILTARVPVHAAPQAGEGPAVRLAPAVEGGWQASGPGYRAVVNKEGYLSSFCVGGLEMVGEPFAYQPRAKLKADKMEPAGDALRVDLKGGGEASIDYQFRPDGLTITPTWRGGGFAEFRFTASRSVLGIELLNDKRAGAGDAVSFVTGGEIRGVPAVRSSRNQMVRFHFSGVCLHAYVQTWGAPFNYESAGEVSGYTWGRPLLGARQPFPIIFTLQPEAGKAKLPGIAFVPRTEKVASLYTTDEPCTWQLDLGQRKDYQYLLDAGIRGLDLSWRLTDIHDRAVASGSEKVDLDAAGQGTLRAITLQPPGSGYYQALFTLSEPTGKMLASSFGTRFTVIHRVPGLTGRDDSLVGKPISDYAIVAMIGVGGIRESHNIGGLFSDRPQAPPDWLPVQGAAPTLWMGPQAANYTASKLLVSELEAYGPPTPAPA